MNKNLLIACSAVWLLSACAVTAPPTRVSVATPPQWYAALPHQGSVTDLTQWWQQQGDPVLVELIAAGQAVSPSVATARSRIVQARSNQTAAAAALLPDLDATGSLSRGRSQQGGGPGSVPIATVSQLGVQTAWEIDVFGRNRSAQEAASERLLGADARWHEARVSVAAEVANQYYGLRSCQRLAVVTRADAVSRGETSRLSELSTRAGFTAPATAALARASAAEGQSRATQQAAQCELNIKALVALSGLPEPDLRQKLASAPATWAQAASISIALVPADALTQRPDVFSAAREVAAASAEIGSARAERYPRLSLSGSIGSSRSRAGGVTTDLNTWSIGPLSVSVPLFDGGRRAANTNAAEARYDEAASLYRAQVRLAVQEVEQALVTLQSTALRNDDAKTAEEGFRASFTGVEARYKNGLASLLELEDARRSLLAAETARVSLQQERLTAWVSLYRAMGGGWTTPAPRLAQN